MEKLKFAINILAIIVLLAIVVTVLVIGFPDNAPSEFNSLCSNQAQNNTPPCNVIEAIPPPKNFGQDSCKKINETNFLSKVATFLITPITSQVNVISQEIFIETVGKTFSPFHTVVFGVLTLYVVIWGIYIALGLTQTTLKDFIIRVFKIGIIMTLLHPTSYNFFNDYLFKLFVQGSQELIGMVANPYCDGTDTQTNYFAFTNYAMHNLFGDTSNILLRLSSMVMSFPIGWLCFIIFCQAMFAYFVAILRAILAYLIAYTAVGLVISLGPIFIVLILFKSTQKFFKDWISVLISFAMEPVILFASIVLITLFINQALYDVMGQLEWQPFLQFWINLDADSPCGEWCVRLTFFHWYLPSFYNDSVGGNSVFGTQGLFASLTNVQNYLGYIQSFLVLTIGVGLLNKVGTFATMLSTYLFGGAAMQEAANSVGSSVKQTAMTAFGMDSKSQSRRADQDKKRRAAEGKAARAKRFGGNSGNNS